MQRTALARDAGGPERHQRHAAQRDVDQLEGKVRIHGNARDGRWPVSGTATATSGAAGHRREVPEVIFCARRIVCGLISAQHVQMLAFLRTAFAPLNLAALLAIGGIGLSLRWLPGEMRSGAFTLLIAYTCCLLLATFPQRRRWAQNAALLLMPLLALAAIAVAPRMGTAQILLVVWAAVVVMAWPPLVVLAAIVAVDLAAFGVLRHAGHSNPVITTILYASFQGFAALTSHYARSAEEARDRLARTNADLLATRALLADAARDGERLRVARELHDVAGHKLTALRL
ncbi:MAG TPA: histidine kinase, partial [Thermomonas sp.]|nr:histidine kinase [Thermomonas sp.]